MQMSQRQALEVLARHRGGHVVIAAMSAAGIWPALSDGPLDFCYLPSTMGQASALGLGLALAVAPRGVVVINGDGSTLMNLGSLVTIAAHPAPLTLIVLENGIYEVTGGQPTAGSDRVDFCAIARGAGIPRVYGFDTLEAWQAGAAETLAGPGPVFIRIRVEARSGQKTPSPPGPMDAQIARLREALGTG